MCKSSILSEVISCFDCLFRVRKQKVRKVLGKVADMAHRKAKDIAQRQKPPHNGSDSQR